MDAPGLGGLHHFPPLSSTNIHNYSPAKDAVNKIKDTFNPHFSIDKGNTGDGSRHMAAHDGQGEASQHSLARGMKMVSQNNTEGPSPLRGSG
jgi:hypothetical protein